MEKTATLNLRVNPIVKQRAEQVLAALGIVLFSTGWAMLNLKKEEAQG